MKAYAMIDTTATKSNPSLGFCNTKKAIAFSSKVLRDSFLDGRSHWDLSARKITRAEAMKMLVLVDPNSGDKGLPLDQTDPFESSVVLAPGKY